VLDFADNVVLVCGSRNYKNDGEIERQLEMLPSGTWVVEGEAPGADTIARECCLYLRIPFIACPANWDRYGNKAGPMRNMQMQRDFQPNAGLAFHNKRRLEDSEGTFDMVTRMRNEGVLVRVFGQDTPLKKLAQWRRRGIYG